MNNQKDRQVNVYKKCFIDESPEYDVKYNYTAKFEAFGILHNESSVLVSTTRGEIFNIPLHLAKFIS